LKRKNEHAFNYHAWKINLKFYEDLMDDKWDSISNDQERMGLRGHTGAPFSTHPVPLERSRWDDSNHTLKYHQI